MARYNREEHKQIIVRKQVKEALDLVKKSPDKYKIKTLVPLTYSAIIKSMLTTLYGSDEEMVKHFGLKKNR